ncbi:MAG: hypothetical protein ACI9F9_002185 [Candidatus Paceibacteria bacterium]|jgi:hypothetical protein
MPTCLTTVLCGAGLCSAPLLVGEAQFAAPVPITVGSEPIRGFSYPSPTLHDLDGDGSVELLVGDLRGRVVAAQPRGKSGAFDWQGLDSLQVGDEDLRLNNW